MANYDDDEMVDAVPQRVRSTVQAVKKKGRGFRERMDMDNKYGNTPFESLPHSGAGPLKSVEGYVIFVSNVHEEGQEEDLHEAFAEYGDIKNIFLNLDRRTGFVKGYALIEYATKEEALDAITNMNGREILTQPVYTTWAFSSGPARKTGRSTRR